MQTKNATAQGSAFFISDGATVSTASKGAEKRLTVVQGLRVDDALAYYDETGFKDWVREETGASI